MFYENVVICYIYKSAFRLLQLQDSTKKRKKHIL
jgi:hypothetical protein